MLSNSRFSLFNSYTLENAKWRSGSLNEYVCVYFISIAAIEIRPCIVALFKHLSMDNRVSNFLSCSPKGKPLFTINDDALLFMCIVIVHCNTDDRLVSQEEL